MKYALREATVNDADTIATVHVRAWQAAYRGVMPDDMLDRLSVSDRAELWRRNLTNPEPGLHVWVAVCAYSIVGFTTSGPERGEGGRSDIGELYAINLDPDVWRHGVGCGLLRRTIRVLAADGYRSAVLWVVPENKRARALYESEGWTEEGTRRQTDFRGAVVDEVRYQLKSLEPES